MEYISRSQEKRIFQAFSSQMITGILGPRRVGKSTLIAHYFNLYPDMTVVHFNMDKMQDREQIKAGRLEDMILNTIQRHIVPNQRIWVTIDEAQKCPEIFEQIKVLYDHYKDQNAIKFILTGSALLELHRLSAESLAGRIQLYYLSAFNLFETARLTQQTGLENSFFDMVEQNTSDQSMWQTYQQQLRPHTTQLKESLDTLLLWGGLPETLAINQENDRLDYLGNYLQTYLEKDVRAIESITDLTLYRHLMDILAAQTGSVRDDSKITQALTCHRDTLHKYRGYLQATLMYQELHPYINSTLKRLIKSPKGYFINNGLISYLTGLHHYPTLVNTGQMGHRLENWFFNELQVWLNRHPGRHSIHYWRTSSGVEVDFIVNKPPVVYPFEITFSKQIEHKKIKNLLKFREYEPKANIGYYIYRGDFHWDSENNIICLPAWWMG